MKVVMCGLGSGTVVATVGLELRRVPKIAGSGTIEYEEYIHCGKARDITFAASNSFEQKISGGNAFQAMSRDFHRAAKNFDLFRLLSMFHTGSGLFATSAVMFWALSAFVLALLELCQAGADRLVG